MRKDLAFAAKWQHSKSKERGHRFGGRLDPERAEELSENKPVPITKRLGWEGGNSASVDYGILEGVIRKQLGRPWNKVYSELCESFKGNSGLIEREGKQAVKQIVITDVEEIDGKIYRLTNPYTFYRDPINNEFYVHPKTGLLCWAPREPERKKKEKPIDQIKINGSSSHYFELIGENWFETTYIEQKNNIRFAPVLRALITPGEFDLIKRRYQATGMWSRVDSVEGYLYFSDQAQVSKKSCNKKQMKYIREYLEKHA